MNKPIIDCRDCFFCQESGTSQLFNICRRKRSKDTSSGFGFCEVERDSPMFETNYSNLCTPNAIHFAPLLEAK